MTEISFHFNAPHRIGHACRVLRKAQRQGVAAAVTGSDEALSSLDAELWSLTAADFVAHSWVESVGAIPERLHPGTVWLARHAEVAPVHGMLVNLGDVTPHGFETFERVIEVVTPDESERQAARLRWKDYARRGYSIVRHEVGA